MSKSKNKKITTIYLETKILEELEEATNNKSQFINDLLREHLPNYKKKDVVDMGTTVRSKNLYAIIQMVDEHQFISYNHLEKMAGLELGITPKRFKEYVDGLAYLEKVIVKMGWVVSPNYNGLMPWTDEYKIQKNEREMEEFNKRHKEKKTTSESDNEVDDILNAEVTEQKEAKK